MRPHRLQPTRLPRPWDSPGKNTGVGCHFLLHCMKVKSESEVAQSCLTLSDPRDCSPPGSPVHKIFQAGALEWAAIAFSTSSSWEQFYSFQSVPYMTARVIFKCMLWVTSPIPVWKCNVQLKQKECPLGICWGAKSRVITSRVAGVIKKKSVPGHIFKEELSRFSNPFKFKFQRNKTLMGTLDILFLALWFS